MTQNLHKYREVQRILSPSDLDLRMLDRAKTEIQSADLKNIAVYAAKEAAEKYRRTIIVEDSGLFIEALRGFPGPFSSYVFATIGSKGLLNIMRWKTDRRAFFQASVAIASPEASSAVFSGRVYGTIARGPKGKTGFGFDPIFVPIRTRTTFAQGGEAFKNKHSHRAIAFRKLANWIRHA